MIKLLNTCCEYKGLDVGEIETLVDNEREWRKYLVQKVDKLESLHADCSRHTAIELSALKVKAGMWGALSGGGVVVIGLGVYILEKVLAK